MTNAAARIRTASGPSRKTIIEELKTGGSHQVSTGYTDRMSTDTKPAKSGKSLAKAKSQARMLIIVAAGLSLIASVLLFFLGGEDNQNEGIFIGLWVPSILALGALLVPAGRD